MQQKMIPVGAGEAAVNKTLESEHKIPKALS
jgi:hypothetical protein